MKADAERILTESGRPWRAVVAVDCNAIMYENKLHKARTLWLHRNKDSGKLETCMTAGFQIWPPDGFAPELRVHSES